MPPQREWFEKDYYKILGSPTRRPTRRSPRRTGSWPASSTRTPTPTTRRPRTSSRRSRRPTRWSVTPPSGPSTTRPGASAPWPAASVPALGRAGPVAGRSTSTSTTCWATCSVGAEAEVAAAAGPVLNVGPTSKRAVARFHRRCPRSHHHLAAHLRRAVLHLRRVGAKPGTSPRLCQVCGGRGVTDDNQGLFSFSSPCYACGGRGRIIDTPCSTCSGSGTERRPREVKVRIPRASTTASASVCGARVPRVATADRPATSSCCARWRPTRCSAATVSTSPCVSRSR